MNTFGCIILMLSALSQKTRAKVDFLISPSCAVKRERQIIIISLLENNLKNRSCFQELDPIKCHSVSCYAW